MWSLPQAIIKTEFPPIITRHSFSRLHQSKTDFHSSLGNWSALCQAFFINGMEWIPFCNMAGPPTRDWGSMVWGKAWNWKGNSIHVVQPVNGPHPPTPLSGQPSLPLPTSSTCFLLCMFSENFPDKYLYANLLCFYESDFWEVTKKILITKFNSYFSYLFWPRTRAIISSWASSFFSLSSLGSPATRPQVPSLDLIFPRISNPQR